MTREQQAPCKLMIIYGKPQFPENTIAFQVIRSKNYSVCEKQVRTIAAVFK